MPKLRTVVVIAVLAACAAGAWYAMSPPGGPRGYAAIGPSTAPATRPVGDPNDFAVSPPPLSEGIYPCSQCHNEDMPANPRRRILKMAHKDIVLHHDEQHRWCLDCHDAKDRDVLHAASGAPIKFTESYKLCGQCHGDKYRDWQEGVHGKQTGSWAGVRPPGSTQPARQRLLCANCHNPHSPLYGAITPEPPPRPQQRTEGLGH